jgi:hypothetical protein
MKSSKSFIDSVGSNTEETTKISIAFKVFKYAFFMLMLAWISVLPSCMVAVHTPHPPRHTVIISSHDEGKHHNH